MGQTKTIQKNKNNNIKKRQIQKKSLKAKGIQLIEELSRALVKIIPATVFGNGLSFQNIAKDKSLKKYWKDKGNKDKKVADFLKEIYKYKPIVFRKIIRENISAGITRRHRSGDPVLKVEMDIINDLLIKLDIDMRKEIGELNLPDEKPVIVPPPIAFQKMIKDFKMHPFFDECVNKYLDGYMKECVRMAFEKIEKLVKDITGESPIGKQLMSIVFNEAAPKIKIKSPVLQNLNSRKEGFKFIMMGSMLFIRNPFSHGDEPEILHNQAFELLCFANYLYRVIIEAGK